MQRRLDDVRPGGHCLGPGRVELLPAWAVAMRGCVDLSKGGSQKGKNGVYEVGDGGRPRYSVGLSELAWFAACILSCGLTWRGPMLSSLNELERNGGAGKRLPWR